MVVFSICRICEFMTAGIPYFLIASGVEEMTSVFEVPRGRSESRRTVRIIEMCSAGVSKM